jgi:hypothetical protein
MKILYSILGSDIANYGTRDLKFGIVKDFRYAFCHPLVYMHGTKIIIKKVRFPDTGSVTIKCVGWEGGGERSEHSVTLCKGGQNIGGGGLPPCYPSTHF